LPVELLADQPSHQNEIASLLHPMGRNTLFWLVKRWNPWTNPQRAHEDLQRTALSFTIPLTLLALTEVIE
jgi:hypothetical protein